MLFLDGNVTVDVNKLAEQLAKIAGPIAQHGWEVYVRQQYVMGAENLISAGLLLIPAAVWLRYSSRLLKWAASYEYRKFGDTTSDIVFDEGDRGVPYIFVVLFGVLAAFGLVFATLNLMWAIAHLANPEYGAIQGILGR